jgi:hypothetical protein
MAATQVSKSQCTELQTNPGYYLLRDAAYAWDRAVTEFGKFVLITGAWRSYETQLRIFEERYDRGNLAGRRGYTNDFRWWPAKGSYYTRKDGFAAAAVPGTSNHGGGLAVDVKTKREKGDPSYEQAIIFGSWADTDRTRFLKVAAEHGWDDDEGRSVNELWHLTYYPARDRHRGEKPKSTLQEEPMADGLNTEQALQLSTIHSILTRKLTDGSGATTPDQVWMRTLDVSRRTLAAVIAAQATPASAEVDVDANDVADALLERLTPAVAQSVADVLAARLAK